jgi:hypothetical protein
VCVDISVSLPQQYFWTFGSESDVAEEKISIAEAEVDSATDAISKLAVDDDQ